MKKQKEISELFYKMQSKGDLLALLNYVLPLVCERKDFSFTQRQLNYYSTFTAEDSFPRENNVPVLSGVTGKSSRGYATFKVTKKSGKFRTIHAPHGSLKLIQKCLNYIFQNIYTPHTASYGFIPGKSIVDNAQLHTNKNYVYNIDLKDFFPSIDQARVRARLLAPPFNLGTSEGRTKIANIIAILTCTSIETERLDPVSGTWVNLKKNVLPQGAPTSPTITNIICERLDRRLSGLAKRFNLTYSRYADDITFSSMHHVYGKNGEFITELHKIIHDQSFHVQENKTRLQKQAYKQEVTGLTVNNKINVNQRYIKTIRKWIYYWEQYGEEKASGIILKHYLADKGHVKHNVNNVRNIIAGKLEYLKMVRGANNELYLKLNGRFEALQEVKQIKIESNIDFAPVIGTEISTGNQGEESIFTVPILHNPITLVNLLNKFSENNHPLKYACHSWDDGRVDDLFTDYANFIEKFDKIGRSVCFEIQKLKKPLGTKILHFLNTINEDGKYYQKDVSFDYNWGQNRMQYGWKSKELSNWAKENPTMDPFEFPLPRKSIITKQNRDIEISKFGDVIRIFKDEIEIRPEESALYNLIAELRRKYLGRDFKVNIDDSLKGMKFYTDVHYFKRALNKIFREVSVRTIHPIVSISGENFPEFGYTVIEILHHESYCKEKSTDEMMKEILDGDFADIKKYYENLCDWSIESNFNDGSYRINYLSSDNNDLAKIHIENAEGFKHIFKFYKL